jgi:DNA-binding transcriptional ArsR family regulator
LFVNILQFNAQWFLFNNLFLTFKIWLKQITIVILQYKNIAMGASKTDQFTEKQNELAILAKALGHPARIAIIEYLLKVDTCICGDIVNELPLAQPTVSQHLKELKNAGLIKGNFEGASICYCIDEVGFEKIKGFFQDVAQHLEKTKNQCC